MLQGRQPPYIPPLGYHWLTPCYDLVAQLTVRDRTIKQAIVEQLQPDPGQAVLDIGCGTGTLALQICRHYPHVTMIGIDRDQTALDKAAWKAGHAGLPLTLFRSDSRYLPFPGERVDQVVTTLFFHHLDRDAKRKTLKEVNRILKPGGRFLVADWGKADTLLQRLQFLPVQVIDGFAATRDNVNGELPDMFARNGFDGITELKTFATLFGPVRLWACRKGALPSPADRRSAPELRHIEQQ